MARGAAFLATDNACMRSARHSLVQPPVLAHRFTPTSQHLLQRKAACACGGGCPRCQAKPGNLKISQLNDPAEIEADQIAAQVMRMPIEKTGPVTLNSSVSEPQIQRQPAGGTQAAEKEPEPIGEGLATVAETLDENNPAFSELTEELGDRFRALPAPLSVGVPLFLGANYLGIWALAMANPAMRRHLNDFNLGMASDALLPQFPIKTFTYRILDPEQTRFEFDLGLDVSGIIESLDENSPLSTLSFETAGRLNTEAPTGISPVGLSSLNVNLGLFDDGLMFSGGFRQGVDPYPLLERDPHTGAGSRIMQQVPGLPDLYPGQQDIRFMLQVDFVRLYNYFNPQSTPIRSVPQQLEGDRIDRQIQRKEGSGELHPAKESRGGGRLSCEASTDSLKLSQPNYAAEIEADAIADRVMRMSVGDAEPKSNLSYTPNAIHRKCASCEDEENEETILRRPLPSSVGVPSQSPNHIRRAINSSGRPLDLKTRNFFEPCLGYDLGGVRIHTDSSAGRSASRVNARAYTIGNDIVFGGGEYDPETERGKYLLAHELAHTIQQDNQGNAIRRTPIFGTGTDRIHGDLLDQYAHDIGQARDTVTQHDPGYEAWILAGALSVDKATYLWLINSAIGRMSGNLVDSETLATTVVPILRAMAGNPVWKDPRGNTSGGSSISHTIGTTTLNLTLILNDDPDPLRPAGLFNPGTSATDVNIEVFIRKNATIEELMQTLYHESMHMASWLINRPTSALGVQATGRSGPRGAAAILDLARSTTQISSVRLWLDALAQSVNGRRSAGAQITAANLDQMARWLVEEINVRVETEVFRLAEETQGFLATRGPLVYIQPGPNWQINTGMVDRYVFDFSQVFLPTDRAGLTAVDQQTLATLLQILEGIYQSRVRRRFSQAPYLVGRGIPRAPFTYTPPPLTPPTFRPLPLP